MIGLWIGYALAVTMLLAVVARLFDRIAELRRWSRRWIWIGALVSSGVVIAVVPWRYSVTPAASRVARAQRAAIEPPSLATDAVAPLREPVSPTAGFFARWRLGAGLVQYNRQLQLIWGAGTVLLGVIYLAGSLTLMRRRRRWREAIVDGTGVLVAAQDGPAVAGVWHPRIVLPEWALDLDPTSRALMIAHEAEHVRVRDPLVLQVAMLLLAAMPWNVAAWLIVRRLRLAVELDCDARVLAAASGAPQYGELLLTVARHHSPEFFQAAPAFLGNASSLRQRITAMHPRRFHLPCTQSVLAAATALLLLVLGSTVPLPRLQAQGQPAQEPGALPLELRSKGSPNAPVTVYEMVDFQCPFCGAFERNDFPAIDSEYIKTGKVRWIVINFPLAARVHANSTAAAEFGACAASQGQFWATHDMLLATRDSWADLKNPLPFFDARIAQLNLNADQMNSCRQSGRGSAMVKADLARAEKAGANSTPSFFTDDGQLGNSAPPITKFRHLLDSVYAVKTKSAVAPAGRDTPRRARR